jgi:hypothetical protein
MARALVRLPMSRDELACGLQCGTGWLLGCFSSRRLRKRWDRRVTVALGSCVLLATFVANRPDDALAVLLDSEGVGANLITTDSLCADLDNSR